MKNWRACVIGAGVAGLGAAAALAPEVERVVVFDKDSLPEDLVSRKGVPQGEHIHILLEAGVSSLEHLLPGFRQDLVRAGSSSIRAGLGQQIFAFGRWYPERDLGFDFLGQSRPRLEGLLRRRVQALPNVELRPQERVERVLAEEGRILGVTTHVRGGSETVEQFDIVVDASGVKGGFARELLRDAGVPEETHPTDVYYSTVHFQKPMDLRSLKENILITSDGEARRVGGSLIDVEEDTWCVSLHGRGSEDQPGDLPAWMHLAQALPDGRIFQRVSRGRALNVPTAFRKATAVFRRFDRIAARVPLGYFPAGDTIASFNPIFGQGMTVAFGHARALREAVVSSEDLVEIRTRYLDGATSWSKRAWRSTTLHDLGYAARSDSERRAAEVLLSLARARQDKAMGDAEVHRQIVLASQMMESPGS